MRTILFFLLLAPLSLAVLSLGGARLAAQPGMAQPATQTPVTPPPNTQPDTKAPTDSTVAVPGYLEAPTFFELLHENYSDDENLTLLHEGRIRLIPLGIESIENFNWKTHTRTDQSWWNRMESLLYLIPLMASENDRDTEFVKGWITGWLDAHGTNHFPNKGCRDAMTAGQRAIVLTWHLKQMQTVDKPDTALANQLKTSIKWHQEYLDKHYNAVSNHAMWESMGLLETTRVHTNPKLAFVALQRLLAIVELSTSEQGFHTEHSPVYHFYYLRWLSDFAAYLSSLPGLDWPDLDALVEREHRMHKMTYYLCDHRGRLSQIGDTDSMKVDDVYWRRPPRSRKTAVFDETAGYAIFKDPTRTKNRRYVLFRILKHKPKLPFHTHDDCLAVYYSWDGEVILSDQGRYSYTRSSTQRYYKSISAHNTVVPSRVLSGPGHRIYASETWWEQDKDRCFFGASLRDGTVTRAVEIPTHKPELKVFDTILGDEPFSLLWHIGSDVVSIGEIQHCVHLADSTDQWRRYTCELTTAKKRRFLITIEVSCGQDDDDVMVHTIKGWDKPMLGWYSSGYNSSVPASVIRVDLNVDSFANVRTRITRIQ